MVTRSGERDTRASASPERGPKSRVYHPGVTDIFSPPIPFLADEVEAAVAEPSPAPCAGGVGVVPAIMPVDPGLVLLDLQIGNMGGVAACLAVRQREKMGNVEPRRPPPRREIDVHANEARADTHLVKPLNAFQILRRRVVGCQGRRRPEAIPFPVAPRAVAQVGTPRSGRGGRGFRPACPTISR